ncbi:stage II sporulation protein AA (anti-sigma F factor antagonist) [Thermosediminibacter litoriperuensis]|uniref:Anti-sigma factor antagonist n=1 Tax=Thermosediminibacter litoriperuensis TaxID=291989 RepID=A0A5S5AYJ8_9FIRM|nr:STAS domain-containing protein [Thermosediminibacter litoriperuensis]TYP58551.1 stage II sporulation protein AA (anti-sigma F factor antagonist) [Thermosediminibacter litoriperuensis]
MEIRVRQQKGMAILEVEGELDFSNVDQLQQEIQRRPEEVVEIDLQGLRFIDSSGVGMLLSQARHFFSQGRTLKIVNIPDLIREDLEVIGFFQVLEVLKTNPNA